MAIKIALPQGMEEILKGRNDIVIDVRIGNYINDDFLKNNTVFNSYYDFVKNSPFTDDELAKNSELFQSKEMNDYINKTTNFKDIDDMFSFAMETKLQEYFDNNKKGGE